MERRDVPATATAIATASIPENKVSTDQIRNEGSIKTANTNVLKDSDGKMPVAVPVGIIESENVEFKGNVRKADYPVEETTPVRFYNILSRNRNAFRHEPVPQSISFNAFMGNIELDFSSQTFIHPVIHINASLVLSSMKVIVPPGVAVVLRDNFELLSSSKVFQGKSWNDMNDVAPIKVIIGGTSVLSSLKVDLNGSAPHAIIDQNH